MILYFAIKKDKGIINESRAFHRAVQMTILQTEARQSMITLQLYSHFQLVGLNRTHIIIITNAGKSDQRF